MTPPIQLKKGDRVLLASNKRWYTVTRKPYQQHLGYTCNPDPKPIPGGAWLFTGNDGTNTRQLQVIAIAEVWRNETQIFMRESAAPNIRDVPVSNLRKPAATHLKTLKTSPGAKVKKPAGYHFRLLDLYCGQGLAAWGYWLSGRFSEIVGVDIELANKKHYSFDFIHRDALTLDYDFLSQFDFIHASPPCQAYSKATPRTTRHKHIKLVAATHLMLYAANKPYVIENVEGSGKELKPNIALNGHCVGLPIDRRRYFHASELKKPIRRIKSPPGYYSQQVHNSMNRANLIEAMGLEIINPNALKRMTKEGMLQGIPPAMTQYISTRLFPHKLMIG